jgi:hypothetical protein
MPSESTISVHREIQQAAKVVLHELAAQISATDTECSIAEKAYAGLCRPALAETWYYRCPAFVLRGTRSCLSISGRNYEPIRMDDEVLRRQGNAKAARKDLAWAATVGGRSGN